MGDILEKDGIALASFQKWQSPGGAYPPVPVEMPLGRHRKIKAVRKVRAV
jgi:hypothetical protein